MSTNESQSVNLGTRRLAKLRMADFPNADTIVHDGLLAAPRSEHAVDIMLVNPPTPDGELWIRTQHRPHAREYDLAAGFAGANGSAAAPGLQGEGCGLQCRTDGLARVHKIA